MNYIAIVARAKRLVASRPTATPSELARMMCELPSISDADAASALSLATDTVVSRQVVYAARNATKPRGRPVAPQPEEPSPRQQRKARKLAGEHAHVIAGALLAEYLRGRRKEEM